MEGGLDQLIESLLTEIAFSGVRGCSVTTLLEAIKSFYKDPRDDTSNPVAELQSEGPGELGDADGNIADSNEKSRGLRDDGGCDLAVASKVWRWLVLRPDVSVGVDRQFNHLSLDDILGLPEEEIPSCSTGEIRKSQNEGVTSAKKTKRRSNASRAPGIPSPSHRPRLRVSEERQWKTLAGHGPDLKRVPLYEWRALVDIASVKEKGILQGDLVRLSGQDKRSLPMRTDALAKKGYIIKQPIILRGCRSSMLWLAQFADSAKENRDGLNPLEVNLTKAALTRDLLPVPFSHCWNGGRLDYIAIAQAFNAVVKAWGIIRYCDIRVKLDVEERVPQMRALAKTSRWFTSIGAVAFVAAKFAGNNRLFKDCVKFIREPTAEEWRVFRSTPKAYVKLPSARLGKRGQASRERHRKEASNPQHQAKASQAPGKRRESQSPDQEPAESLWTPYKPIVNTVFEIIKRAGPNGSVNLAVSHRTLGYNYRKYIVALIAAISSHSQPSHLEHFDVTSQLYRVGKTMTYHFFAKDEIPESRDRAREAATAVGATDGEASQRPSSTRASRPTFSQPLQSKFAPASASSLAQLSSYLHIPKPETVRGRKRKGVFGDGSRGIASRDQCPRDKKVARIEGTEVNVEKEVTNDQEGRPHEHTAEIASTTSPRPLSDAPERIALPPPPPRPPGVYREPNNFLDPPGRRGRRRKSLVLTLKLESLKNASFLARGPVGQTTTAGETREVETPLATATEETISQNMGSEDPSSSASAPAAEAGQQLVGKGRVRGAGTAPYRCDKCGKSWKNPNGLDYHLTKSRTTCNPNHVQLPHSLPTTPLPKRAPPESRPPGISTSKSSADNNQRGGLTTPAARRWLDLSSKTPHRAPDDKQRLPLLPSKRIRQNNLSTTTQYTGTPSKPRSIRGSLILQDIEAYTILDHRRRRENLQVAPHSAYSTTAHPPQTQTLHGPSQGTPKRPPRNEQEVARGKETLNNTLPGHSVGRHEANNQRQIGGLCWEPNVGSSSLNPPIDPVTEGKVSENGPITDAALPDLPTISGKSRKPSARTLGATRRERSSRIIQLLLDGNEGVFPGKRSLYLAVVSFWIKEYSDMPPPDWKVLQNVVNRMEKEKTITQNHFFFIDGSGKLQDCCVLVKNLQEENGAPNSATDAKVVIIKEKMREMFPEPYIPEAFSPSQVESELFDALASKYRDDSQEGDARKQQPKSNATGDIEVLRYPAHIMSDVPVNLPNSKRLIEEVEDTDAAPTKKARVEADQSQRAEKTRKRREYWQTGDIAQYIWNQKRSSRDSWDQRSSLLQDFERGTWSSPPEEVSFPWPSVDVVLSSLQKTRENSLPSVPRRPGRQTQAPSKVSRPAHMRLYETSLRDGSPQDGENEEHEGIALNATENAEGSVPMDLFVKPSISTSFVPEDVGSEEEEDDITPIDTHQDGDADDFSNARSNELSVKFTEGKIIQSTHRGYWPRQPTSFFESNSMSFMLAGAMPDARWFQRENLPQSTEEIVKTCRGHFNPNNWVDPSYGKFLREVDAIERWEQSTEGSQILLHGSIAPDYIFLPLGTEVSGGGTVPVTLEWPSKSQYTADNMPNEIKDAPSGDGNAGFLYQPRRRGRPRQDNGAGLGPERRSKTSAEKAKAVARPQRLRRAQPEVQYKMRSLRPIPIQHRGRVSRPKPDEGNIGLNSEDELIAAHVVFKTLLGGIERLADLGSILQIFPKFSLSALRRFWSRISRERKTYIDALTSKFQSAFLEAYETGDIPPLNYDDIDSYDWKALIIWTSKLETHENVDLPGSRRALDENYSLENPVNEIADWREIWFSSGASIYSRVEAVSGEPLSKPLEASAHVDEASISLARSWVRSLCCTPITGAEMPERIRAKLLELAGRDEAETNELLKRVVDQLTTEKIAARSKGKILGQSLRLHGVFVKQLEKQSHFEKLTQAVEFKASLDEAFGRGEEFLLPYAANDGMIIAALNLQAYGRVRIEPVDMPHIPLGFEPGNYDGRTFPKSYYHFQVKVAPTASYVADADMPVLARARAAAVPRRGPRGEVPIWVDLFGRLDEDRWAAYLGMTAMALATKGPLTPAGAAVLLKPLVEPFEAELVAGWLDGLGLAQRVASDRSAAAGEWWWLVAGQAMAHWKEKGRQRREREAAGGVAVEG
ncbi:hypothetical protein GGS23DRAFT_602433 [Durotheca rogersii]|uniref:uncharacterized protein n=1 Tax=Durotheca rogersii TaxID=419775 RepID=UPI0022205778|nr:uncharacterized protein GGS23DRAFT_602433 [Durotheca rogersii]KAI5867240.1 hypothetical protein GGS23DRAFT_602433 [Durotheca rogersii]